MWIASRSLFKNRFKGDFKKDAREYWKTLVRFLK